MIMIKGMMTAAASVAYTLGLLLLITYVFSIAIVNTKNLEGEPCWGIIDGDADTPDGREELLGMFQGPGFETGVEKGVHWPFRYEEDGNGDVLIDELKYCTCTRYFFPTVLEGMHNLIVFATFLDNLSFFIVNIKLDNTLCFILAWTYISLASLTVMNMLIGVLCEVISAVAEEEKEGMMVEKVNDKFGEIVSKLDTNSDGTLCWDEFQKILDYPEALKALNEVNVDPESMVDMAEDLFFEDGEPVSLTFQEFMEMVLDLRGGQGATVKDIMSLGKRFSLKFVNQKARIDNVEKKMDNACMKMEGILKHYQLEAPDLHATTMLSGNVQEEGNVSKPGSAKSVDKLRLAATAPES